MAIITGCPTTDREVDLAYEAESARLWEAQQPEPEVKPLTGCSFDTLTDAHAPLVIALDGFSTIETYLDEAIAAIHDTPEADKLASVMDSANDLRLEVKKISDLIYKRMFPKGVQ